MTFSFEYSGTLWEYTITACLWAFCPVYANEQHISAFVSPKKVCVTCIFELAVQAHVENRRPLFPWQLLHTISTTTRGVFRKIELKTWCPIVWWYAGFRDADVLPDHGAGAQNTPQARSHRSHQRHCILCENGGQRTNTHNTDSTRLTQHLCVLSFT